MRKKSVFPAALLLLCLTLLTACFGADEDAMAQIGEQAGETAVLIGVPEGADKDWEFDLTTTDTQFVWEVESADGQGIEKLIQVYRHDENAITGLEAYAAYPTVQEAAEAMPDYQAKIGQKGSNIRSVDRRGRHLHLTYAEEEYAGVTWEELRTTLEEINGGT